ncbi:MAG: DNA-binding response regulator [Bacteroidetes bacterium HGW-Bacteroidetes-21]|jgi:DNA-binding NarL/FixJ family response regulator|nr:MAG: DNA-binding response regulator [Bacteroidetes bacterium HGW-Bacteroidetes-21]
MKNIIEILIVDDHNIVRSGITSVLEKQDNMAVVAEASNGEEALKILSEKSPDIVILDISLPDINGIELLKIIKKDNFQIKVILFTMHEDAEYINSAIDNGANGYILKNGEIGELIRAINQVYLGKNFFSEYVSYIIVNEMKQSKNMSNSAIEIFKISPRERDVLKLIVEGFSNKMISVKLNISVNTVAIHRTNIMKKVKAKNAADLVNIAIKNNLF